jgi:hypothetical protein
MKYASLLIEYVSRPKRRFRNTRVKVFPDLGQDASHTAAEDSYRHLKTSIA